MASRSATSLVLAAASIVLFIAGFVFLAFYVTSVTGPHLRYLGAGFLAACAAFVVGCMVGLIVGIPRFVSSGAMRHAIEANVARKAMPGPVTVQAPPSDPDGPGQPGQAAQDAPSVQQGQAPPDAQPGAAGQPSPSGQSAQSGLPASAGQGGQSAQAGQAPQPAQGPMTPMGSMTPMTLVASGQQRSSARTTAPDGFPTITDQSTVGQSTAGQVGGGQPGGGQGGGTDPSGAGQVSAGQGNGGQSSSSQADADQGGAEVSQLTPSTNLAEISDWLTKLLLGAGLVELTRLGHPMASLIDAVARGLQGIPAGGTVSGTPVIVAASILIMYVVLGFLDGYVVTTLWYGKYLQRLGYS
jgi:hypothetical protein